MRKVGDRVEASGIGGTVVSVDKDGYGTVQWDNGGTVDYSPYVLSKLKDEPDIGASLKRQSDFYREREDEPWTARD